MNSTSFDTCSIENNSGLYNCQIYNNTANLSAFLENRFKLSDGAREIADRIINIQNDLDLGKVNDIDPTDPLPRTLISNNKIIFFEKLIGRGTYSTVYQVCVLPTQLHTIESIDFLPFVPTHYALKVGRDKTVFSPQKATISTLNPSGLNVLDKFIETWKTSGSKVTHYALCQLYSGNLAKVNFTDFSQPVASLTKVFKDVALGLELLHKSDHIHRDVKGNNILVRINENANPDKKPDITCGCLNDYDTLAMQQSQNHRTTGTAFYLDPSMFGNPDSTLVNQQKRLGIQTKDGDVYAFGQTLFFDGLLKLAEQYIKCYLPNDSEINELINCLYPRQIKGPFTQENLIALMSTHENPMVYDKKTDGEEVVYLLPKLQEIQEKLCTIFDLLSNHLSQNEVQALKKLTSLSCKMKGPLKMRSRPKIKKVIDSLQNILETLEKVSTKKRKLDLSEDEIEDSSVKRARVEGEFNHFPFSSDESFSTPLTPTQEARTPGTRTESPATDATPPAPDRNLVPPTKGRRLF